MQEKRKKFWIIFSISIVAIFTICLIFGMITNLKDVSVEFRQRIVGDTRLEENILKKVREDGEFEYGKGLLFVDTDSSIAKIEKKNPFVKVEQVIRKFPNIINVYISERVPCTYALNGNYYLVLDKDFKVLDKVEDTSVGEEYLRTNYLTTIYEIDYDFGTNVYEVGDFVLDNGTMQTYKNVYTGIVGALGSDGVAEITSVKSLRLEDDFVKIVMKKNNTTFEDGVKIEISGTDDLVIKTFTAIEFFETIDKTISAQIIRIRKVEGSNNKYSAYLYG